MKNSKICFALALVAAVAAGAPRSAAAPQNQSSFEVTMVARTITVINYEHRGGSTQIGFQGSPIMPNGKGSGKVESKQGRIQINADFQKLSGPQSFGPEYLTFVLWAITPEGKSNNLGEILLDGDKSKISVTTSLQTFGLIVTAEPYFAVSQPSNAVVLENTVVSGTTGTIEQATAKYQSLDKGVYSYNFSAASYPKSKSKTPLELEEARNAMEIAKAVNAAQYASEAFGRAQSSLTTAENLFASKGDRKRVIQAARDAVQNAADARTTAVRRARDEKIAQEKAAAAAAEAKAKADAEAAQRAQQQAEIQKLQAERDAAQQAQARVEAEAAQHAAQLQAQREEDKARQAQAAAAQAEKEKEQLRAQLLDMFNRILPTTDTPRGLKVNMADVLFDFGKFDLKPPAREALAKMSGIVIAHPGLKLAIEGYTDSIGTDTFNVTLSQNRADTVRAYLIDQGLDPGSITATGYGKSNPVASNDTADGRQQNRRVEIIISGELIGEKIGGGSSPQQ